MICVGAAILMAGVISGCSVKFGTRKEPKLDTVVAHPTNGDTGEMNVTYDMFSHEYKFFLEGAGITDDTAEDKADYCTAQRQTIINYLINEQIILSKAKEMGLYELTEEEQKEVEDTYSERIAQYVKYFGDIAEMERYVESEEINPAMSDEEKAEEGGRMLDELLERCGMTRDDMLWWAKSAKITEKLRSVLYENIPYSKAEEEFKNVQAEAEELYKTNAAQYSMMGYDQLWLPEGSRLIKHILLGFDNDTASEIRTLRNDGKSDEADKKRAEAAEALGAKREEIEKKLDEGVKIDELIKEYSADAEGSEAYPDGYTVVPNGLTYMEEFQKAAFVPEKIGDRTVCVTDYGVHIMLYAGDAKIADKTIKDYTEYLHEQMKQKEFSDKMKEWAAEYAFEIDYETLKLEAPVEESSEAA